jgi:NADH dehydrogenase FAD-containing subunit
MLAGFVAGHYALEDCAIALAPLLKNGAVDWLTHSATEVDANARRITLEDGSEIGYQWLSIDTGPVQPRALIEKSLPGAREHGLFVRPLENFATLWPRVVELAASRALRVAVIGGGATAVELAMAIRQRLPDTSVSLITGLTQVGTNYPPAVRQRVLQALKQRSITLLPELAVGIGAAEVFLKNGARLACDVPLIAMGSQAPPWLANSGLALDQNGYAAVDTFQRSISHPHVFAAHDASMQTGAALASNVRADLAGIQPQVRLTPASHLHWVACGSHFAIAGCGKYAAQGRWAWWLKDWLDRSHIQRWRDG